jgi:hypothetical protein
MMGHRARRLAPYLALAVALPAGLHAQVVTPVTEGSSGAAVAGGALAAFSGVMLGTLGSIIPCSQTYAGPSCVRVAAIAGGVVGGAGGIYLGAGSDDAIESAARGAGFGLLFGTAAGIGLKLYLPRFGWADVVATGAVGASFGASARGASLGLAAGSLIGFGLFAIDNRLGVPNALSIGLMGAAVGGIGSWFVRAVQERQEGSSLELPPVAISLPVGF